MFLPPACPPEASSTPFFQCPDRHSLPQPDPAPQGGSSSDLSFSLLFLLIFGKSLEGFLKGLNVTYLVAKALFEFAAQDLSVAAVWGSGNPQQFAGWLWRSWVCCPASAREERSRSGHVISMSDPFLIPLRTSAPVSKLRCFTGCLLASLVSRKKQAVVVGRAGPCLLSGFSSLQMSKGVRG